MNFMLIYAVVLMHILQMLKFATFPTMVCCLLNAITCLYVGSTRSLAFYNVKREDFKEQQP